MLAVRENTPTRLVQVGRLVAGIWRRNPTLHDFDCLLQEINLSATQLMCVSFYTIILDLKMVCLSSYFSHCSVYFRYMAGLIWTSQKSGDRHQSITDKPDCTVGAEQMHLRAQPTITHLSRDDHNCWWPGDAMSNAISNHSILLEKRFFFSIRKQWTCCSNPTMYLSHILQSTVL